MSFHNNEIVRFQRSTLELLNTLVDEAFSTNQQHCDGDIY